MIDNAALNLVMKKKYMFFMKINQLDYFYDVISDVCICFTSFVRFIYKIFLCNSFYKMQLYFHNYFVFDIPQHLMPCVSHPTFLAKIFWTKSYVFVQKNLDIFSSHFCMQFLTFFIFCHPQHLDDPQDGLGFASPIIKKVTQENGKFSLSMMLQNVLLKAWLCLFSL